MNNKYSITFTSMCPCGVLCMVCAHLRAGVFAEARERHHVVSYSHHILLRVYHRIWTCADS